MIDLPTRQFIKGSTWRLNDDVRSGEHIIAAGSEIGIPYPRRATGAIGIKLLDREPESKPKRSRWKNADFFVDARHLASATLLTPGPGVGDYFIENEDGDLWWGAGHDLEERRWGPREYLHARHHESVHSAEQGVIRILFRSLRHDAPTPKLRIIGVNPADEVVERHDVNPAWMAIIHGAARAARKVKGRRRTEFRNILNRLRTDDPHPYAAIVEMVLSPLTALTTKPSDIKKKLALLGIEKYQMEHNFIMLSSEDMMMFTLSMTDEVKVHHLV